MEHPRGVRADALAIMSYVESDIAARGGTGRRLGRVWWDGPVRDYRAFCAAVRYIESTGLADLDRETASPFGWVYLVPKSPQSGAVLRIIE